MSTTPAAAPTAERRKEEAALLLVRYEVGRLLGHGTFAKVYHAKNVKTNESVAIKVLTKEKIMKGCLMAHIKREIAILRRVRHPNIVQLFEVMATRSKICFVMEFLRGGELFKKVTNGRLNEDASRRYFQQLISAVGFCHARGVYHRDLKPENLLLDENGDLKVSDFGLSAVSDSEQTQQDGLFHTLRRHLILRRHPLCSHGRVFTIPRSEFDVHASEDLQRGIPMSSFVLPGTSQITSLDPLHQPGNPDYYPGDNFKSVVQKGVQRYQVLQRDDKLYRFMDDVFESESDSESELRKPVPGLPRPASLNAFDIISFSKGFNLSGLFEEGGEEGSRFVSGAPVSEIISKLEEIAR